MGSSYAVADHASDVSRREVSEPRASSAHQVVCVAVVTLLLLHCGEIVGVHLSEMQKGCGDVSRCAKCAVERIDESPV